MKIKIKNSEEYWAYFKSISDFEEDDTGEITCLIKEKYGRGIIKILEISNYMSFAMMDFCLNFDLEIEYNLVDTHFEISCCIDGGVIIRNSLHETINIKKDSVMLVNAVDSSKQITGCLRCLKDFPIKNISFSLDRDIYSRYHKSIGDELWGELLTSESLKDGNILLAERLPHIKVILLQIFETDIKNESLKKLFIESKVIEVLTQVAYANFEEKQNLLLSQEDKRKIIKVPELMMQNAANPDTIRMLARKLNIDPNKLKRGFKYVYGDTIYSYFKKLKLQRAAYLLQTSDMSVLDIALDVGYKSQSQFGVSFKKHYGLTPYEYSKMRISV